MKRWLTLPLLVLFFASLGCSDDEPEADGASVYNGIVITVTGPRTPDGLTFRIPAEDANETVSEDSVFFNVLLVNIPAEEDPSVTLPTFTMQLDDSEPGSYGDDRGEISLSLIFADEDPDPAFGSDGEFVSGEVVLLEASETRVTGTIDVQLNNTAVGNTDVYDVVGTFDVRD